MPMTEEEERQMAQRRFEEYRRLADAQIEEIMKTMMTIKVVNDRASTMQASQNLNRDEGEDFIYTQGTLMCSEVRFTDVLLKKRNSDELFEEAFKDTVNKMYSDSESVTSTP